MAAGIFNLIGGLALVGAILAVGLIIMRFLIRPLSSTGKDNRQQSSLNDEGAPNLPSTTIFP